MEAPARRIVELDGMRAVAILAVMQLHLFVVLPVFTYFQIHLPTLANVLSMGWCGVDGFFVLSGFLIGGILIDRRRSPNLLPVFFARRALRILPIYYVLLMISGFLLRGWPDFPHQVPLWAFFLFLCNFFTSFGWQAPGPFGPLWSIAIEEQFYLAAPALIRRITRRPALALLGLAIALPPLLRLMLASDWLPTSIRWLDFTPTRIDGLAFGVLGAWLVRDARLGAALTQARATHRVALVLLGAGAFGLSQFTRLDEGFTFQTTVGITFLNAWFLAILLYVVLHGTDSKLAALFRWRPLRSIGRVSYFLYLFHIPALIVITNLGFRSVLVVLPATAILLGVAAWVSWRWFESPLIAMGHRLSYERTPQTPVGASGGS